jgi:hypothetical protein
VRIRAGSQRQSAQAEFDAHQNVTRIDQVIPGRREIHVKQLGLVLLQTDTPEGTHSVTY